MHVVMMGAKAQTAGFCWTQIFLEKQEDGQSSRSGQPYLQESGCSERSVPNGLFKYSLLLTRKTKLLESSSRTWRGAFIVGL